MKKIQNILIAVIATLSLSNCASFSIKIIEGKTITLTQQNIKNIEGTYAMKSYDSYLEPNVDRDVVPLKNYENNDINNLTNRLLSDEVPLDQVEVDIEILSKEEIRFSYRIQSTLIKQDIFTFKLRENGMLYLENRKATSTGIPHFIGSIDIKKSRIGLSKDNDLCINHVQYRSNVAIILGHSQRINTSFYFKRLSNK